MDFNNDNFCTLYIVRHGETEWNAQHIVMGQKDSPLTELGLKQAEALKKIFYDVHFDAAYSSDLLRTKRTAEIIALEKNLAIETRQLLRERSYGHFEGKPAAEYRESIKHLLAKWQKLSDKKRWTFKFSDDIESDAEVAGRFITILREIAAINQGKTVLIVAHGACLRTFLVHIGFASSSELPSGSISNGGYVKILSDGLDFIVKKAVGLKMVKS